MALPELRIEAGRWGWVRALYASLMKRLSPLLVVWRVHVRALRQGASVQDEDGIAVRKARPAEFELAVQQLPDQISAEFVAAAAERGDFCVIALDGRRVVAFVWRSYGIAPFAAGLRLQTQKPYRYGYKAYTHPDYRGRRLQDRIALLSDEESIDKGFTHAVSLVQSHNYPSIRSDQSRGNRLVGFILHSTMGGRTRVWHSRGAKKHKIRLTEE